MHPYGLIVNEVLTTTYKYAFGPSDLSPQLKIEMENDAGEYVITLSDNGDGFDPEKSTKGIGLEIVNDLVEQLEGSIQIDSSNGTNVIVSFNPM